MNTDLQTYTVENPYASPKFAIANKTGSHWPGVLYAVLVWWPVLLAAMSFWLLTPLFLLTVCLVNWPKLSGEPVWFVVSVLTAIGISAAVLFIATFIARMARQEIRSAFQQPVPGD